MAEFWNAFHFLRPWWLLLLFIPVVFYLRYFRGRRNQSSWEKVCDKRLLGYLLIRGSSSQRKVLAWTALIGICTAIAAAAGPSWEKIEIPSLEAENPVMILLNMSSDMKETDLKPSRLERAKYKITDLLKMLQGAQAGLEVYSREPFVISPLTDDTQILENLLGAVDFNIMPVNGDRLDRALALAVEKFVNAAYQRGEIIIFAPDAGQRFDLALEEAKKARNKGFKVNVIATTAAPVEKLQMIADVGGGRYSNLQTGDNDIKPLATQAVSSSDDLKEGKNWQSIWLDYGYYLLIIPLLCCLYFFRKGILVIVFVAAAQPANAGFFLNNNQEGLKAFEAGDYQRAEERFDDPRWKASSLYRMGDYDKAFAEFSRQNDLTALYNQGNALAKSGKFEEAIKKYEEVLQAEPNHEDARFNLEYLKRQQQQKQQEQNQPQEQEKNQPQDQNQSDRQQPSPEKEQQDESNPSSPDQQEQQKQNEQAQGNNPDGNENQQTREQNQSATPQTTATGSQENEQQENPSGGGLQTEGEEPKYDEKVQARAQQYREIPEDPGGLLRAFIYQEYQRNRYNEK